MSFKLREPYYSRVTLWIAALRSGEYTQGRCSLHSCDNYYCCLGVAIKILDPTKEVCGTLLCAWQTDYYGLIANNGKRHQCSESLAVLNDHEDSSFDQIADILEKALHDKTNTPFRLDLYDLGGVADVQPDSADGDGVQPETTTSEGVGAEPPVGVFADTRARNDAGNRDATKLADYIDAKLGEPFGADSGPSDSSGEGTVDSG